MRTKAAKETGWLPLDVAAAHMKRSDKPIRAQIRNERLFAGQHYRVKNDVLELNVPAYLEWLAEKKVRRSLPLVERVQLSYRDQSNGRYGEKAPEAPRRVQSASQAPSDRRLIPLNVWARQVFGEYAPPIRTLRTWCRNGKILPVPRKVGRAFYCSPEARYVDPLAERLDLVYGRDRM